MTLFLVKVQVNCYSQFSLIVKGHCSFTCSSNRAIAKTPSTGSSSLYLPLQLCNARSILCVLQVSLTQNCQPPRRAGRAAQMQTIFIAILFFPSFVGALSMVAYTVWT